MSKHAILGDNTTPDCSEACNSTWLHLVHLQASEPATHGYQIAHLANYTIHMHPIYILELYTSHIKLSYILYTLNCII